MFKKMFGKKKKSSGTAPLDDSIRTAVVGDVIVIPGFSPTFEDAYFIVESKNRLESAYGNTFEIIAVDDDRRVSMEWSDDVQTLMSTSSISSSHSAKESYDF